MITIRIEPKDPEFNLYKEDLAVIGACIEDGKTSGDNPAFSWSIEDDRDDEPDPEENDCGASEEELADYEERFKDSIRD